ncbi:MAG: hypothetical protein GY903_26680 [Fuerstiella sp.]|nr:hypothetical protein [Fuerstiella sp.]MCP4858084.1 hypothetical protein [Fuerstiella sp.]
MALPESEGRWVRPSARFPAQPVWGHVDGLRVGLEPMPGPRGLLRVYSPYLGHVPGRMINFIAVEPTVTGQERRGFSELELSQTDGVRGKRFWSVNRPNDLAPQPPDHPARGVVSREGDVETLEVFVHVERFNSGADPYLRLRFRSDRPFEVGIASFAKRSSRPMRSCVLTATMGNYARLRRLQLADRIVQSRNLWPAFDGDAFAPVRRFPLDQLTRTPEGHAFVSATTDESEPQKADYAPFTFKGWKYTGLRAVQYWRCESPPDDLYVRVNGRTKYWASRTPIPGGISFENFEMVARFRSGQEFWFGVKPDQQ